jgi:hypothetical protein
VILYLDESGDLGFDFVKTHTSKKFVITLLVCDGKMTADGFRKAVRRTLKNKLNQRKSGRRVVYELKGSNTTRKIKEYFYHNLPPAGGKLYTIILNKGRVYPRLRSRPGKKKLYNFPARFILERVDMATAGPTVNLVVDHCKNTDEIKDFNAYIVNQLEALLPLNVPLYITHELSQNNPGLQAVDLFCWGLFRKYEWDDTSWYQIFQPVIAFEDAYLK